MGLPDKMQAMVLTELGKPLQLEEVSIPESGPQQVLVRVHACGVCRTDLHVVDQDLPDPKLPLILGHEIVGTVVATGEKVDHFKVGDRIGVPWLGWTCGECRFCERGRENLCDNAEFTGYTIDGGYAEYTVADQRYCFDVPQQYDPPDAAPLLCAGLIGYRSYRMAGDDVERLGMYGFGGSAHIIAQVAVHEGKEVYAFTRPGDEESQEFARRLGAVWAGGSNEMPPEKLDAAIIFAPVGPLVPAALRALAKGGSIVCAGIHMSDIPSFPYRPLWGERVIRSVANLTRQDGVELMRIAPKVPVKTQVERFALDQANEALDRLRAGKIEGAGVLVIDGQ